MAVSGIGSGVCMGVVLRYWVPLLAFCGAVVLSSSLGTFPFSVPPLLGPLPMDKVAHFIEYLVLGFLAVRLFFGGVGGLLGSAEALVITVLFGLFFGAMDEVHQYSVPGRSVELSDLGTDLAGVVISGTVYTLLRYRSGRGSARLSGPA